MKDSIRGFYTTPSSIPFKDGPAPKPSENLRDTLYPFSLPSGRGCAKSSLTRPWEPKKEPLCSRMVTFQMHARLGQHGLATIGLVLKIRGLG